MTTKRTLIIGASAECEEILAHFNQTVRSLSAGESAHTFFLRYNHDEEITAALSELCDVRVIWGGDETVRRLRAFPLSPGAKELTFPDRHSFAVISSEAYNKLSEGQKES